MKSIKTLDPFSGQVTGNFPLDDFASCLTKIEKSKHTQKFWKKLEVQERVDRLRQGLKYFENNQQEIAKDICEQMGRPQHQALGEVKGLLERGNFMCDIARETLRPDIFKDKEGFERQISHEAYGCIFVIAAWNYPLLIAINSVAPALIAGNTVILKHSNLTPKLGQHFVKAFHQFGDHSHLVEQVITNHEITGKIIEETDIDHVIFTGSVAGGRAILNHSQKRLITPLLELGGKDAGYVHSDANLDSAVESLVDGAMFNSGQSCCGVERVFVHESVAKDFLLKARKILESYQLGDPKEATTNMGPVAKKSSVEYMKQQIDEATSLGAEIIHGGKAEEIAEGHFFQPTLIEKANNKMQVMREENFGPILPVMTVDSMETAVEAINDNDYGLTASIFTGDSQVAHQFADAVDAGTIFMNHCDYLDPALPWTGYKNSGAGGSSLSKYGFYNVTKRKSKHFKLNL